jgi:ornithine carbamoyltransferase
MFLGPSDLQLSRGESLADTARTLSCYVDALVARVYGHGDIGELAMNSSIPVINGLSDAMHPCQALSDVITMHDKLGMLRGMKLAYFGNARNNVLHSLLHTGSKLGINIDVACPQKYEPDKAILDQCHANSEASGARIEVGQDPVKAARNADILYTDVWFSMHEKPSEAGRKALMPYQVTPMLMEKARRGAIFMHCLPAHRGEEVDARVIDGERSVVWDQAKSKLWTHKAILSLLVD